MNHSQLRNIIKEEILKALNEYDPYEKGMERFKEKMGFEKANPSVKNVMKAPNPSEEKEYKVSYWYRLKNGDDEDNDVVTVKAKSEEDAIAKAKVEAPRNSSSFKIVK